MSALKILAIGLTATLAGTAANATQFDYNFKNATASAGAGSYLQFADTTAGSSLTMQVYGGHINDTKVASGSALNSVSATTVAQWSGYGLGVVYTGDTSNAETHQIDNVGGGVDFVALVFSQAVTLSDIGLTAYRMPGNSFIDYDLSYMAYTGSLASIVNGLDLTKFSTISSTGLTRTSASSTSAILPMTNSVASNIWIVSAAVATGDRDDGFKLTTLTVNSVPAAVPEPATWAMMLVGFGGIGGAMRSRRARQAVKVVFAD